MMNWYFLIRPILFSLDPEKAHHWTLALLSFFYRMGCLPKKKFKAPVTVMGLTFENPVGLAAGLDKNAEYIDALASLGFGFIEVGTVTPRPQEGNAKPRLFRLTSGQALINRFGFNNIGLQAFISNLKKTRYQGILGINIGKNKDTPNEFAIRDYQECLEGVYPYASYIVINISSPNTENLRDLQSEVLLPQLLLTVKKDQRRLAERYGRYVPLVVKVAPDLTEAQIQFLTDTVVKYALDGVMVGNTTISRPSLLEASVSQETGGLSGLPLLSLSTQVLASFYEKLKSKIPLIGVGGIMDAEGAEQKMAAGAQLVQVYTGFIYKGPQLVSQIVKALLRREG